MLLFTALAQARSEATIHYTKEQAFSAALRYLRVDLQYEVTERDPEAAYLIFRHPVDSKGGAPVRGAIELIQRKGELRLQISVPRLPGYQEDVFKRGLLRKLREEYGRPPATPPPKKEVPSE